MTATCGNCRSWEHDEAGLGWCSLAESDSKKPLNPETKAFATDVEGYKAFLYTTADFGCVQFKEKDR